MLMARGDILAFQRLYEEQPAAARRAHLLRIRPRFDRPSNPRRTRHKMNFRSAVRNLMPARALHAYRMLRHTMLAPFERELVVMPRYLSKDAVAIDAGANVGLYTAVMARHAARVMAFEPHPDCAAHLRALALAHCDVIEAALSDADGQAELRVPRDGGSEAPALATLAEANVLHGVQPGAPLRTVQVTTLRLDTALAHRLGAGETLGFIKIDVEGHEHAVLRGAAMTIARHRPVLLVEIEARHGSDIEGIFAMLAGLGYEARALVDGRTLQAVDPPMLRSLQSPDRLERKLARPRDPAYVHNVFFLPGPSGSA
jgi:FkbM family methyltransferase